MKDTSAFAISQRDAATSIHRKGVGPTGLELYFFYPGQYSMKSDYRVEGEINELFRDSDAFKDRRNEVVIFFDTYTDTDKRIDYLKRCFDNTLCEYILSNDERAGYRAYDDFVHIWQGSYTNPKQETDLNWTELIMVIEKMIRQGKWLDRGDRLLPTDEGASTGPIAQPIEQSPDLSKEYRLSLGDTIHLGTQEYEIIALGEETVRLFDPAFPLFNKEIPRTDFDRMLAENPLNDHFLQTVEPATEETPIPVGRIDFLSHRGEVAESIEYPDQETFLAVVRKENDSGSPMVIVLYKDKDGQTIPQDFRYDLDLPPQGFRVMDYQEALLEQAKQLINEYCQEEFDQDADYSDLSHVPLAFSTTSKGDYPVDVSADLVSYRLVYQVNGEEVAVLQCHDLKDMQQYLGNLEIDAMIAYAEEQFEKQQEKPPLSPDERFYVVDIDQGYQKAYGVWDDETGALYVDKDSVSEEFTSRWQAEDYLEQVKKQEAEKENLLVESVTEGASSNYDLGYGFLGNGLTVWNRLETEHGD